MALRIQQLYATLCIVWNLTVILQNQLEIVPIGPTGSWVVIVIAAVLMFMLGWSARNGKTAVYFCLSVLVGLAAALAVYSGLVGSADNWPSRFWRAAGIGVNVVGVSSLLLAGFEIAGKKFGTHS